MTELTRPDIFARETIAFEGVDSTTPPGCTLISMAVLGVFTTYLLRDGVVLGRVETPPVGQGGHNVYAGSGLKGGQWLGSAGFSATGFELILQASGESL